MNTRILAEKLVPIPNRRLVALLGPGLVVMLADTDVGSIITASQSGVRWGYQLLLLQLVLVPVLYIVQELTVRLGVHTGKGHGELIRETFGRGWAWLSISGLGVAAAGAIITEFSGVAGVGELFGVPRWASLALAAVFLLAVVQTGSYRRVERIAIAVGLFELVFLGIAYAAHPQAHAMAVGLTQLPLGNKDYLFLVAANIGAVIMPWMIFYQQSAIAEKKLTRADLRGARLDTALGAVLTQLVMVAVLLATAATIGVSRPETSLETVGDIAGTLTPFLGPALGRTIFGLGTIGAAMVAAIVVSLASAWGFGEVAGYRHSLEYRPLETPWFYGIYAACVVGGAALVALSPDLITLNIAVEVMNALMLPLVLGFLVLLAIRALPPEQRIRGLYRAIVIAVCVLTAGMGIYGGIFGAGLF